ncbi:tetratricopeptide repeat protein [Aliikangiella marina]|uniref:Tetratricopeptide repeat protein n=1 Tax=Aliikangiella marina TaxID=1712262 RepID=A0A545T2X8_9GAMM|nr:HEAT repeat domain-containing protein [Aliikangiella marina]TQV71560.1 tetratricopeptide repeat protein [Aliikangiella marina]
MIKYVNRFKKQPKRRANNGVLAAIFGIAISSCAAVYAEEGLYVQGQKQLDNREWSQAQNSFNQLIEKGEGKQDATLYWLAYAYFKGKKSQQALNTINTLIDGHPNSKWVDDAKALRAEIKDERGEAADISDDELKLYAIDSLMSASSERAYNVLSKIINSNNSIKIKKRAMFVLSQTGSKKGFQLVSDIALNNAEPELQLNAIEMMGLAGDSNARLVLRQVIDESKDDKLRQKALEGLMIAGDHKTIKSLAMDGLEGKLQTQAINLLGVMGQGDALLEMYQSNSFIEQRENILDALSVGDGYQQLASIIKTEKSDNLRVTAIERLGIMSSRKSGDLLTELYQSSRNKKEKSAVIQALFIQSNAKALIQIAKAEKEQSLKRKAIQRLSMIDSDESIEFFSKILNQE